MAKILILGNSGAGKSTFAKGLASILNVDLLFLDKITFEHSWDTPNYPIMEDKVKEFLAKDAYIIDGNFINNAKDRFKECDTIFFLDINRFTCLKSVLQRKEKYKGKTRESRSDKCDEQITNSYLKWVFFDYYKTSRKYILKMLKNMNDKKIVIFKNRKQIDKYIEELSKKEIKEL